MGFWNLAQSHILEHAGLSWVECVAVLGWLADRDMHAVCPCSKNARLHTLASLDFDRNTALTKSKHKLTQTDDETSGVLPCRAIPR